MKTCEVIRTLEQLPVMQEATPITPAQENYLLALGLIREVFPPVFDGNLPEGKQELIDYRKRVCARLNAVNEEQEQLRVRYSNTPANQRQDLELLLRQAAKDAAFFRGIKNTTAKAFIAPSHTMVEFDGDPYLGQGLGYRKDLIAKSEIEYDQFAKYGFAIVPAAKMVGAKKAIRAFELYDETVRSKRGKNLDDCEYVLAIALILAQHKTPKITFYPDVVDSDTENIFDIVRVETGNDCYIDGNRDFNDIMTELKKKMHL